MATVYVDTGEWSPYYFVMSKEGWQAGFTVGVPIELTEEELAFVSKADADFRKAFMLVHQKVRDFHGKQKGV